MSEHLYDEFQFNLINNQHTTSISSQIKTKYSYGYDGISSALLKIIINEITLSLTLIINQCLTTGILPDKLKIGKIILHYYGIRNTALTLLKSYFTNTKQYRAIGY